MVVKYRKSIGGYILDGLFGSGNEKSVQVVHNAPPVKSKCPKDRKVEVIWNKGDNILTADSCSFSGHSNCKRCIEKGDYPGYSESEWECEYCGKRFETRKETITHETNCESKKK